MFIKRKHIVVIITSSIIIIAVFVFTLIGYLFYVQWKKDSLALRYRSFLYRLTAELFKNDITISNINVKTGGEDLFSKILFVEGSLKNNSNKTITSIRIKLSFLKQDGTILYNSWLFPLGEHPEEELGGTVDFSEGKQTKNVLLPGDGISFKHFLRSCPREIIEQFSVKTGFAKSFSLRDRAKLVYAITGVTVI